MFGYASKSTTVINSTTNVNVTSNLNQELIKLREALQDKDKRINELTLETN